MENSIPKYNELTQCVKEDGKGGYIVKDLSKEEPIQEEPHDSEPVVLRPYEIPLDKRVQRAEQEIEEIVELLAIAEGVEV